MLKGMAETTGARQTVTDESISKAGRPRSRGLHGRNRKTQSVELGLSVSVSVGMSMERVAWVERVR